MFVKTQANPKVYQLDSLNNYLDFQKRDVEEIQEFIFDIAQIYQIELNIVDKSSTQEFRDKALSFGADVLNKISASFVDAGQPLQGQDLVKAMKVQPKLMTAFASAAFTFVDGGNTTQYVVFTTFRNVIEADGFGAIVPQYVNF